MNLICTIRFGSHLYGTATENSDKDYVGIYMPTLEDTLLGRIPKTFNSSPRNDDRKNLPNELDVTNYTIHHLLRLASQGQTLAIDLLFAPPSAIEYGPYGHIWRQVVLNRDRFFTKEMRAFVGYARAQAGKYSLKGERLNKLIEFQRILVDPVLAIIPSTPISYVWDNLPKDAERVNPQGVRELQIAGKWFGESTPMHHVLDSVNNLLDRYGKRANKAAESGGVDWKALSHAVRVSKELIEILTLGEIRFPLVDAPLLLRIKRGEATLEEVSDILNRDLAFIEEKMNTSSLPKSVDGKWCDRFLYNIMLEYVSEEIKDELDGHEEEL